MIVIKLIKVSRKRYVRIIARTAPLAVDFCLQPYPAPWSTTAAKELRKFQDTLIQTASREEGGVVCEPVCGMEAFLTRLLSAPVPAGDREPP